MNGNSDILTDEGLAGVATIVVGDEEKTLIQSPDFGDDCEDDHPYYSDRERILEREDSSVAEVEDLPAFYAAYRLGPLTLLWSIALGLSAPVNTEFLKLSVCEVALNISANICSHINDKQFKAEGDLVVQETAHYTLYVSLMGSIPPVLFSLFVGSWSDKFGRKLPMLVPFIGYFLSSAYMSVISNFEVSPNLFLAPPVISSVTGGWTILGMAKFSYLADYTTDKNRALNYAVIDGLMILFGNLGGLLGGYLFQNFGRQIPFYVATGIYGASFIYVIIVIRDRAPRAKGAASSSCSELFSLSHLRDSFLTIAKKRPRDTRIHIYVLLMCYLLYCTASYGDSSVTQLFLEFQPFGWSVEFYTLFNCLNGLFSSVILVAVMVVFRRVFGVSDTMFGFVSSLSCILFFFGYGVARVDWIIYVATAVGLMRHMVSACVRSLLSGMVETTETGKIMCVVSAFQALTPLFGSVIFTTMFAQTESWFSGMGTSQWITDKAPEYHCDSERHCESKV
ncbi:putative Solute carrier family 46 member 3 [Hypsibius exemplaris]|uniref:Solute carrier family 46 member 3 n=1 Tax=Hypsibius exemplaris TaxID=2072580 RepID=A0A1W0WSZ4_HYPEX|nr:putative Solute carrier family 46 member 3 [Hypsibius exemplaris]